MMERFERHLSWVVVAIAVAVWAGPLQLIHNRGSQITDIPVYRRVYEHLADGAIPYVDFSFEYPPFAAALFWIAGIIPGPYEVAFSVLMLGCLIATALAVMATAKAMDTTPLRRAGAGLLVALSPLLLGSMVQTRYDLLMAALVAWCLWAAVTRRFTTMWLLLAAAVLVKIVPLALAPVLLVWHRHHAGIKSALGGAGLAAAMVAGVMVPFLLAAPSGTWNLAAYHLDRPLQVESSGASYLMLLHVLADIPISIENSFGSQGLTGRGPALLAGVGTALALALLVAVIWSLVVGLRRSRPPGDARIFMAACCATIVTLLVTGKVLSPQFLIWLLPVAFLVTGRYGRATAGLALAAMALTVAYFPSHYWELVGLQTGPILVVALRNAVLIALLAACWPRPSIARHPRGWMLRGGTIDDSPGERALAARYLAD